MSDQAEDGKLLAIFAAQLGLLESQQADDVANDWARDKYKSVADILLQRGLLTKGQLRSLEPLIKAHLQQHGNDPAQSLSEIGELVPAAKIFTNVDQSEKNSDPLATVVADAGKNHSPESAAVPLATVARPGPMVTHPGAMAADPGATVADPNATVADPNATVAESKHAGSVDPNATIAETRPPQSTGRQTGNRSGDAAATGTLTSEGRRFRVVREHARGGLGQLFVAEDVELNREVALKELLGHHADETESRFRFLREAEITGALEHPGIAPVYGLGQYPDGRPYYAMRFIRGDSLQDAISQFHKPAEKLDHGRRTVELRRLLRCFVSVCETIDYAHVRGVLHRDLKPANVMLGKHGESLVVDWGLATTADFVVAESSVTERPVKPVISGTMVGDVAATLAGSALGTPAYMSPEQAEGALDQLGPATDIYGLGATLYHLLTGRSPFTDRDISLVLKKVREGDFPSPKSVDHSVAPQLNAICLKAMALRPEDRYESADALAKDIEQWLADEPVSVWHEPFHVRAARWMRRHRTVVTSAAAALAVGIIALVLGIVLLTAANERERQARSEAEDAYETARAAVDNYYVQISENVLLNQPGMQGLRIELLQDALDYYDQFIEQHQDDPAVQDELATTHFYAGQLREDMESPQAAVPSYTTAIEIQSRLLKERPGNQALMESLADALNARGRARNRIKKHDEAFSDFQAAARLRGDLVKLDPANQEFNRKQANTFMNMGLVEKGRGNFKEALPHYQRAQAIREQILRENPNLTKVRRDLASGYYNQAVGEMLLKNGQAAAQYFGNAVTAFEKVVQENPRDLMAQFNLATSYRLRGDLNAAASEYDEARRMFEQAESWLEQLAYHNPDVPEFQSGLAGVLMNYANLDAKAGGAERTESARVRFAKSIEILESLVAKHPDVGSYRRDRDTARAALSRLER